MKSKISKLFIIFALFSFLTISVSSCTEEYDRHYASENSIGVLSWVDITGEPVFVDPSILVLPDMQVRDTLVEYIDNAKRRIQIEIYTWTDRSILEAVIRAYKRGVDVQVILEPSVFGTPTVNKAMYTALTDQNIRVVYADNYRYTFTHAKLMIIDDRYFISTGNFTKSFFTSNRDFIISDTGTGIILFLGELFDRDFEHLGTQDISTLPSHLVISPIDSRKKIQSLLLEAKNRIIIYTQTLSDDEILEILSQARKKEIEVHICTAKNESNSLLSEKTGEFIWKTISKPYLHAKIIFIDRDTLFIGSQNLTQNSLDNNREIGIIIRSNSGVFSKLMRIYQEDCQ